LDLKTNVFLYLLAIGGVGLLFHKQLLKSCLGLKKYKLHEKFKKKWLLHKYLFDQRCGVNLIKDSTFLFVVVHDVLPGLFLFHENDKHR